VIYAVIWMGLLSYKEWRSSRPTRRAPVARACGSLLVGLLVGSLACAVPDYGPAQPDARALGVARASDAGAVPGRASPLDAGKLESAVEHDASAAPGNACADCDAGGAPAAPPPWAALLLGQHAMRARFFARSMGLLQAWNPLKNEYWLLATFRLEGNEVRLSTKTCRAIGENNLAGLVANVAPLYTDKLPVREYLVRSDGREWWTEGEPLALGFQTTPLVPCPTPGAKVPRAPEQAWITEGQCTCPALDAPPPTSSLDCRVDDLDGDRSPGVTVSVSGAVATKYSVRLLDSAELVHGVFDPSGRAHAAHYAPNSSLAQLGCAQEPCPPVLAQDCHPSVNPVLLRRLAEAGAPALACDDVLAAQGTLFPADSLEFPSDGC